MKYKTEISELSGEELLVGITDDGKELWIPKDPANSDYQAYLDRDKPKAALSTPSLLQRIAAKF